MHLQCFSTIAPARRTTATRPPVIPISGGEAGTLQAELPTDTAPVLSFDWFDRTTTSKSRIDSMAIRVTKFGVIVSKPLAEAMAQGATEVHLRIGISKDQTVVGLMPAADGGMYNFKLDSKTIRVGATSLARKLTEVGLPLGRWIDVAEQNGVYLARVPAPLMA